MYIWIFIPHHSRNWRYPSFAIRMWRWRLPTMTIKVREIKGDDEQQWVHQKEGEKKKGRRRRQDNKIPKHHLIIIKIIYFANATMYYSQLNSQIILLSTYNTTWDADLLNILKYEFRLIVHTMCVWVLSIWLTNQLVVGDDIWN